MDAIYLTEEEIERIYKLNISKLMDEGEIDRKSTIEQTRDLFIIACWTGLRRSDINRLEKATFNLNGNPTLPLQKHGVRPRCPFFDAPRF